MIYLYVIESCSHGSWYVGICADIPRRLNDHEVGRNRYTKGRRPWKLIHSEEFPDWATARIREKYYKSACGKRTLKQTLHYPDKK